MRMRNPVTVRRIAAVAVAPLLLAGLVACGPDDEDTSADSATTSSGTPSTTPSATESDTGTPDPTPTGATSQEPAAGEKVDPAEFLDKLTESFANSTTARLEMSVDSAGLAMSASGQVDYTGDTPAMALKMTAPALGDGTIDMRLIDQVMYMAMPMLDPSGKFFRIDLKDPDNPLGDSLGDLSSFDPQSTLKTFSKGVRSVRLVGDETIDGDSVTHYRVTTATKDLSKDLGGASAKLPKEFSYDIWLDEDSRMRKFTADVGKQTSIQMNISDWGEPVDIQAPPASQVQQMPGG